MDAYTIHRGTDLSPEFLGLELRYIVLAVTGSVIGFISIVVLAALEVGILMSTLTGLLIALAAYLAARRMAREHHRTSTSLYAIMARKRYPMYIVSSLSSREAILHTQLRIQNVK